MQVTGDASRNHARLSRLALLIDNGLIASIVHAFPQAITDIASSILKHADVLWTFNVSAGD